MLERSILEMRLDLDCVYIGPPVGAGAISCDVPIGRGSQCQTVFKQLIASGYIAVKVVQYSWGLDFELLAVRRVVEGDFEQ